MRFPLGLALLALGAVARSAGAQDDETCVFRIANVDRQGSTIEEMPGITNYFAGGNVKLYCEGTKITMQSDSVAAYGRLRTVEFIGHVDYRDATVRMQAERGTYYRDGDRWEARGSVATENLENGSTLRGPSLDYYRPLKGVRDTLEIYSIGRPTIRYFSKDATGRAQEPYVIIADRVRMRGEDRIYGGGRVTIDRSDFAARSDSLRLDTGAGSDGTLIGKPALHGLGPDSFSLVGRRIDLKLDHRELTYVTAEREARAVGRDFQLGADTIGLDLEHQQLVQALAWGDSLRPEASSGDHSIRADSLAIDTPDRQVKEIRSFGHAWVGGKPDSLSGEQDWVAGDTVVIEFTGRGGGAHDKNRVRQLEARSAARAYYRTADRKRPNAPSLSYSRGDRITVLMKEDGDGVGRVDLRGAVDGVHLEPLGPARDSTTQDSTHQARVR